MSYELTNRFPFFVYINMNKVKNKYKIKRNDYIRAGTASV